MIRLEKGIKDLFVEVLCRQMPMGGDPSRGRGRGRGRGGATAAPSAQVPVPPPPCQNQGRMPRQQIQPNQRYRQRFPPTQNWYPAAQPTPPPPGVPQIPIGQHHASQNQIVQGQQQYQHHQNSDRSGSLSASSEASPASTVVELVLDHRYSKMICFNCGVPGHFIGNCVKPKLCFICNLPGHPVYACPEWLKEHPSSSYFGSASSGMGFYHIDVPDVSETRWLNFSNCGLVTIKKGNISSVELERNLTAIFCKNKRWPWQMCEVGATSFVVRLPPWKDVRELCEFPAFDLEKEGVTVKITARNGEVQVMGTLG